jgi:soluble lytic murein transglycosylase-like protein
VSRTLILLLLLLPGARSAAGEHPDPYRGPEIAWYDHCQRRAAREAGIDWRLAAAVRIKESFNDPDHISTTGAVGLMQLMPTGGGRMYVTRSYRGFVQARRAADRRHRGRRDDEWAAAYQAELQRLVRTTTTRRRIRLDRRFDPCWNIRRGTLHLARDLSRFARRHPRAPRRELVRMTLGAFFAGPGRVRHRDSRAEFTGPRAAIERYVADALGIYDRLRAGLPGR